MNDLVQGAEAILQTFGDWPSFHDAEVLEAVFNRKGKFGPSLKLRIYVFQMTGEVDSKGFYVLKDKSVVTFRFDGIEMKYFENFGVQNVLWDLFILPNEEDESGNYPISVEMPTSFGLSAVFSCRECSVLSCEPYDETT